MLYSMTIYNKVRKSNIAFEKRSNCFLSKFKSLFKIFKL